MALIQEDYLGLPRRVLIACILLNRSRGSEVRKMIGDLFRRWPTARSLATADEEVLTGFLRPLGLQRKKARAIMGLSAVWPHLDHRGSSPSPESIEYLPGVGKYALDSYRIFVRKETPTGVTDKELLRYLEERKDAEEKRSRDARQ